MFKRHNTLKYNEEKIYLKKKTSVDKNYVQKAPHEGILFKD